MDEKCKAAIAVLEKRRDVLTEAIRRCKDRYMVEYYKGKMHGYEQAIDLLKSSVESIKIEL